MLLLDDFIAAVCDINALIEVAAGQSGNSDLRFQNILHRSIMNGEYKISRELIAKGADVNIPDGVWMYPLNHWARRGGPDPFDFELLESGADVSLAIQSLAKRARTRKTNLTSSEFYDPATAPTERETCFLIDAVCISLPREFAERTKVIAAGLSSTGIDGNAIDRIALRNVTEPYITVVDETVRALSKRLKDGFYASSPVYDDEESQINEIINVLLGFKKDLQKLTPERLYR